MVSELIRTRTWATEAGTARYVQRHGRGLAADAYSAIGRMQLSSLGIGTYLGPADDATDARYVDAIVEAVRQGINVIDTASNYRQQRSERAVGRALARLLEMGEVYRSEVLVASKAGFVPLPEDLRGDPMQAFVDATVGRGLAEPDELRCRCHCIAPRYLEATLAQSRANLGIDTIDVYFVHNPESQLQEIGREALLDRIRRAFTALEKAVSAGHIRVYGVATWTGLRADPAERDYLSLADLVACAEAVAGRGHHFKAIQLPLNLHLPEAALLTNQQVRGQWMTALDAAAALELVTFASGSLHQGRVLRRPTTPPPLPDAAAWRGAAAEANPGHAAAHTALQYARSAAGVHSALVGMASVEHVRSNARTLQRPRAGADWTRAASQRPRGAALGEG